MESKGQVEVFAALGVIAAIIIVVVIIAGIAVVPAGNVGVADTFGQVSSDEWQPGFYLKAPWTAIVPMSIKTQEIQETAEVPSKEGLIVRLDTSILFKLDSATADQVYKGIGVNYIEVVIQPQLRSIIRETTAKYEAKALYTSAREQITQDIFDQLEPRLAERGITLEKVLLRDLGIPATVTTAIESKLKAEQEADQMQFVLQKEKLEAERKTVEAEGIKSAQTIIAQSLTPEYLHWYWIQQISAQPNVMYIATEAGLPLFKDIGE
jgi:prohibitin 1